MKRRYGSFSLLILAFLLAGSSVSRADWIVNGVPISTTAVNQEYPVIAPDGAGGAIIVWLDYGAGASDIYAQRIAANGNALWTTNGVAICIAPEAQFYARIIPDGSGGAIVAWQDGRNTGNVDIYAQRIDANGIVLWDANGVAVGAGAGNQHYPDIVPDGAGGAIVTWDDTRGVDADIYAQRLDGNGHALWAANGVALCAATGHQFNTRATADGAGGAIVSWADYRSDGTGDIYAQRVDPDGDVLWTPDGVAVCSAVNSQRWPQIASDNAGGAIVVWPDYRGDTTGDIYARRVDAGGNALWTPDGVAVCAMAGAQGTPVIVADGAGGAIIAWSDKRSDSKGDIYAQRVDANGNELWGANDLAICAALKGQETPNIAGGGGGGAIIAWEDDRWGSSTKIGGDIYAQSVDAAGNTLWGTDGVAICTATNHQMFPELISDGCGGAIVTWEDARSETNLDIYAQRVGDEPIATLLSGFSASIDGSAVEIAWSLSSADEGIAFIVLREDVATSIFEEIAGAGIDRDGLSFRFMDTGCESGTSYRYRVDYVSGSKRSVLFETETVKIPAAQLALHQNHPNPFNPSTTIRYSVPERCHVTLEVFDISGRQVVCLVNETEPQGLHTVAWDGTDAQHNPVASGIYFYRLAAGKEILSRKMILLK
jgi:hypothetical protein